MTIDATTATLAAKRALPAAVPATILAAVLGLGACAQVQEPAPICNMAGIAAQRQLVALPAATPNDPSPLLEMPLNSVNITDHKIINKVYVRQVVARRTETGTVEVVARVLNCTDYPLNIEGRVQFFDQAQAPSEPVSAWRRMALPARAGAVYDEKSIGDKGVQYYLVELRETR